MATNFAKNVEASDFGKGYSMIRKVWRLLLQNILRYYCKINFCQYIKTCQRMNVNHANIKHKNYLI